MARAHDACRQPDQVLRDGVGHHERAHVLLDTLVLDGLGADRRWRDRRDRGQEQIDCPGHPDKRGVDALPGCRGGQVVGQVYAGGGLEATAHVVAVLAGARRVEAARAGDRSNRLGALGRHRRCRGIVGPSKAPDLLHLCAEGSAQVGRRTQPDLVATAGSEACAGDRAPSTPEAARPSQACHLPGKLEPERSPP